MLAIFCPTRLERLHNTDNMRVRSVHDYGALRQNVNPSHFSKQQYETGYGYFCGMILVDKM